MRRRRIRRARGAGVVRARRVRDARWGRRGRARRDAPGRPALGVPAGDAEAAYRYRAEEIVRGVEPEAATAAGGVAVLVATGSLNPGYSLSLACAFGTIAPVRARASDRSGFVECVAPNLNPSLSGAFVSVRLGVGCEFGRGGAALRIVSAPVDGTGVPTSGVTDDPREEEEEDVAAVMLSASPATGSADGGTRLAVFGSNLARYSSNRIVRFGDVAVVGHFVSSALVVVETPAVDYFGPTRLGDGGAFSNFVFSYVESARVDSVSPSVVHPSGGTALAIKGSFGRGVFYCRVGTIGPIPASSVDAGTVECVAPARDEGAAVVTVASGFGDVHGTGEVSLAYELPRVKKADEDKPPEPEVAAVVPFAGPLGGGSPCTSSARSSPRSPPRSSSLAARWPRRTPYPPPSSSSRRPRVRSSGRWLCTDPRVSAACSRTWRTSMKVPSPWSPPSSEPTAARRSPSSAPRSARVEPRGRLAESARSVPSRRRTREATGSSAGRPRRSSERAPSRLEPTTGPRGRRAARCSRRTRRAAFSRRHPRLPREPTSQTPRFPSSACGFTYERMRGRRLGFPLSTAVPTRVSWLFESTIHQLRRRLSTTRAAACTRSWSDSPPRRCGASRRAAAASRADP